uniref:DDB1 and CUL4 associated factor 7 n=1 Tax=Gasterosteus aculeatus aculeatus TaxID=481459 RepID=A0AAQ4Q2W7_GASAC
MSLHGKRKEIYKYEAPWTVYAMNWSVRPDKRFRLALGSFVEEYNNKVQIVGLEEENSEFVCRNTFDHPYPTTKVMWIPDSKGAYPDLLATSGDYLRIWRVGETETRLECLLNNNKNSDFCAPLTSFDWNEVDPNLLGKNYVMEVNLSVLFSSNPICCHFLSKQSFFFSCAQVVILDVRVPCTPVARLNNHRACVNGIAWAPHSSCHICTAAEDHQALIWDIQQMPRAIEDPILAYTAEGEINNVQWATTQPDWIAICYNNCLEILRV